MSLKLLEPRDNKFFDGVDASANQNSSAFDLSQHKAVSVLIQGTDLDQNDAVVKLQVAPTAEGPWADLASATATLDSADAVKVIEATVHAKYLRVDYAKGTVTAGTVNAWLCAKGIWS